ncbi:3'-5' exonuclease [Deltaproteobacteria bacterium TL4]
MTLDQFPKRMNKDALHDLPLRGYEGPIHVITSADEMERAVENLFQEQVLGFDTETRPAFKKGEHYSVSLLQLAAQDEVYLIRLNQVPISESLAQLLSAPEILKIGVAVHDDIKSLNALYPFEAAGFVDLSNIAKKLNIITVGLRNLAGMFLKIRISKGAQVSNWENQSLTATQIRYAATDAWICREIYQFLKKHKFLDGHQGLLKTEAEPEEESVPEAECE